MPCSDKAWGDLWIAFDLHRTEQIRVPRPALSEVMECEQRLPLDQRTIPTDLIATPPRDGSTTVLVNRDALFKFLKSHPGVCDAP